MKKTIETKFNVNQQVFVLVEVKGTPNYLTPRKKVEEGRIDLISIEYTKYDEKLSNRYSMEERIEIRYNVVFPDYDKEDKRFWEESDPELVEIFETPKEASEARDAYNAKIEAEREQEKKDHEEYQKSKVIREFEAVKAKAKELNIDLNN